MHRLTLAWLFAQEGWGTKVLQRFPAQGSGRQERARGPPLLGDSVLSREEGCGLEGERGGFPPTGPPRRKMKAISSQLHLDDSCRVPVTGGGEPTVPSQESALRAGGCTGNEADGCRLAATRCWETFAPGRAAAPTPLHPCGLGTLPQVTQLGTGTGGLAPCPGSSP